MLVKVYIALRTDAHACIAKVFNNGITYEVSHLICIEIYGASVRIGLAIYDHGGLTANDMIGKMACNTRCSCNVYRVIAVLKVVAYCDSSIKCVIARNMP